MTLNDVLKETKEREIRFIDLWFSDMLGCIKNVTIPTESLQRAVEEGVWFDGSSIEGFGRLCESDMYLVPDVETFIPLGEEEPKSARIICDVYSPDHTPFKDDPRGILKRILKKEQGYQYNVGAELEFYLFLKNDDMTPLFHDRVSYFDLEGDLALKMRKEITDNLKSVGIKVEAGHHEVGAGQHEIDLRFTDAIKMADNILTAKTIIKRTAEKHGTFATFIPKPVFGKPGNGMHLHQSIFIDNKNRFSDVKDKYNLSKLAYSFLAGQLKHIREISLLLAPTVNSYKRLVSGFEAPVYISWGQMNRSALIRIPKTTKDESIRLEIRCPDPTANPYLAFASLFIAGLDGIEKNLTPPPPQEDNLYERGDDGKLQSLPNSLFEALEEFSSSLILRKKLGRGFTHKYYEIKKREWEEYSTQVSRWEIDKYMDIY